MEKKAICLTRFAPVYPLSAFFTENDQQLVMGSDS